MNGSSGYPFFSGYSYGIDTPSTYPSFTDTSSSYTYNQMPRQVVQLENISAASPSVTTPTEGDHTACRQQIEQMQLANLDAEKDFDSARDLYKKAYDKSKEENSQTILQHATIMEELVEKQTIKNAEMNEWRQAHHLALTFTIDSLSEYARSLEMVVNNLIQETNRDYLIACKIFQAYNVSYDALKTFFQGTKDIAGKPINWIAMDVNFKTEDLNDLYPFLLHNAKSPRFSRFEKFAPSVLSIPVIVAAPAAPTLTTLSEGDRLIQEAEAKAAIAKQKSQTIQTTGFRSTTTIKPVLLAAGLGVVTEMPSFIDDFLQYFLDENPEKYIFDKSAPGLRPQSVFSQTRFDDSLCAYYSKYPILCSNVAKLNELIDKTKNDTASKLTSIKKTDSDKLRKFVDIDSTVLNPISKNPPSKNVFISFADAFRLKDSSGNVVDIMVPPPSIGTPPIGTPRQIIDQIKKNDVKTHFVVLPGQTGINKKILDDTSLGFASNVLDADSMYSYDDITTRRDTVIKTCMEKLGLLIQDVTAKDLANNSAATATSDFVSTKNAFDRELTDLRDAEANRLAAEQLVISSVSASTGAPPIASVNSLVTEFERQQSLIQEKINTHLLLESAVLSANNLAQTAFSEAKTACDALILEYTRDYFMYLWMVFHQTAFNKDSNPSNPDGARNVFYVSYP